MNLPIAHSQLEHLIGEIVVSMTGVPDRTLNLPSGERSVLKVQLSQINRVWDASERLMISSAE